MDELIELLPLPSVLLNWPHPTNHVAIRDYARACVAHATTAKDAEIEALRAEVERLKVVAHGFVDEIALKDRRAEQLAEALRYAVDNPDFDSERFDALARAALEQEACRG